MMEEKMMILKMLQEGKISAEEANKLLDALNKPNTDETSNQRILNKFEEKARKFEDKARKFAENVEDNINFNTEKVGNNAERFADDFSRRMESFGNDIAESAVKFADKLVNYFGKNFEININKYQFNKDYSFPVSETPSISVDASNFAVKVYPGEADKITMNVYANSSLSQLDIDKYMRNVIDGNKYSFITDFPHRTYGSIELYVPQTISNLTINTSNGKCEISSIVSQNIKAHTSNGKVVINECENNKLDINTSNGKVVFEKAKAKEVNIITSNGKIDINECFFDNIDAKTSNGSFNLVGVQKLEAIEANYKLETSNGKIYMGIKNIENCGYMIDASTSLGKINIELPELAYSTDKKNYTMGSSAVIKSNNINTAEHKIYINAHTSNASISIEGIN